MQHYITIVEKKSLNLVKKDHFAKNTLFVITKITKGE